MLEYSSILTSVCVSVCFAVIKAMGTGEVVDFLININSVVRCWDVSLNTGVLECSMVYGCVFHNGCVEAKLVLELEFQFKLGM